MGSRTLVAAALAVAGWPAEIRAQAQDLTALRARADLGDAVALTALGDALLRGEGVAKNVPEAIRLYERAVGLGHAPAMFNLATLHEAGNGLPANAAKAFELYRRAADQGLAVAQFNVGNMIAAGNGTKADPFEAILWYRQAAEGGVAEAQYNLGLAYETGKGIVRDEAMARRWYREAADQGFARAQYNLALMLEEGRGGPTQEEDAVVFYRRAASQDFGPAQNNLGIALSKGRGGKPDLVEAHVWLSLAVEKGSKPLARDFVAGKLTPAQLSQSASAIQRERARFKSRPVIPSPGPWSPSTPVFFAGAPATESLASDGAISSLAERVSVAEAELSRVRAENDRLSKQSGRHTMTEIAVVEPRGKTDALGREIASGPASETEPGKIRIQPFSDELSSAHSLSPVASLNHELKLSLEKAARSERDLFMLQRQFNEVREQLAVYQAAEQVAVRRLANAEVLLHEATRERDALRRKAEESDALRKSQVLLARELEAVRAAYISAAAELAASRMPNPVSSDRPRSFAAAGATEVAGESGGKNSPAPKLPQNRGGVIELQGKSSNAEQPPGGVEAPPQKLSRDASTSSLDPSVAPRFHIVMEGESLTRISTRYYGTASRWQEIYEANREVLKGENTLRPGQRLRIP